MINYSITARAVNPNLFEINQAKTRINQAKAEGKTPDPKDEALVETVVTNYFATAQYTEVMTIEKFARHIADHGTTYSRADIMAILYMAVDCMREQLLEGKKIRLGELGDFSLSLSSKGAETAEKFSSQNIQRVTVCWEPGSEFRNLLADAEFNLVATRSAQAAVLKAIKEGKTNVDISAPINPGTLPGSPSNPGGTTKPKKHTLTVRSANESQGSVSGGGTFDEGSTQTVRGHAEDRLRLRQVERRQHAEPAHGEAVLRPHAHGFLQDGHHGRRQGREPGRRHAGRLTHGAGRQASRPNEQQNDCL